ncbi:beta-lactamase/transpeptidase-like protein [Mytilinidion resinicola]|uniref:Beta-lactamase/transpeptidase-like protein n=1 Tax=Mytilinidion resinicola TaxID=574789 RepID=A0A6A6YGY8_9PEZI|nr:beta-lactamase/transpeptidase-like protein [Mytilinidion resinicola]KAF2807274.1 beta-lactamase/transpeptidase-like protein [Mytilinidion resinicola]
MEVLKYITGDYIFKKAAGYLSVEEDAAPIQFNTTFSVASLTKLITTIAALQCVERGQITLDEPTDKLLPELDALPLIEPAEDDEHPFKLKAATRKITLRHLLTHASGVCYDIMDPSVMAWRASRGEESMAVKPDILKAFTFPRLFEAGEGWSYGTSVDWAGFLVGRLNKTTLEEYCDENIFKPLGMDSTTWRLDKKPAVAERLMPISLRAPDGKLVPGPTNFISEKPLVDELGGSGLHTSVPDYTRVLADLLKESPALLKKETVDMMFTPQFEVGSKSHEGEFKQAGFTSRSLVGGTVHEWMRPKLNWGLGGVVTTEEIKTDVYYKPKGTLCWSGMPNLVWAINRELGLAWVYATQILPQDDDFSLNLVKQFETEVWKMKP